MHDARTPGSAPTPFDVEQALDAARSDVVAPQRLREWSPTSAAQLRALHERFISDPVATDLSSLRPVIARSWIRSVAWKIDPGMRIFDEMREPRLDAQVLRCADPVLDELERMSTDTGAGITLTDPFGAVAVFRGDPHVRRWADRVFPTHGGAMAEDLVGTNSDGTALEEGIGIQVWGAEHYVEGLREICCTAVPIRDPLRRSVRAILGLSLPIEAVSDVDPRSVALIAEGAAAEVTRLLAGRLALREQALLTSYLAEVRKRGADSIVVMDDRTTIASKGAMQVLEQSDYAVLAGYARESERRSRPIEREVTVGTGSTLHAHVRPISEAGDTIGSVIRLQRTKAPRVASRRASITCRSDSFGTLVGESLALRRALDVASAVVKRRMPAYLVGERGTGKATLAAAMAQQLADNVLTLDCARMDLADHGVVKPLEHALQDGSAVVLCHVDDAAPKTRRRLIELLAGADSRPVVLTMSSVHDESLQLTKALGGVEIEMPPLRSRRDDIPLLVSHFLATGGHGIKGVTAALLQALTEGAWAGNVAQLKEFVDTAAVRCSFGELGMEHLSEIHRRTLARNPLSSLEQAELQLIREALAQAAGNRVRAAKLLQIGRSTLYRKIETYSRRGFSLEL